MTEPTETDTKTKERASLLARGIGLLFLSLGATMLLPSASSSGEVRAELLLVWGDVVTFVLGVICVAGYVLAEVLRRGRPT
jgi:hypothetical protein